MNGNLTLINGMYIAQHFKQVFSKNNIQINMRTTREATPYQESSLSYRSPDVLFHCQELAAGTIQKITAEICIHHQLQS